MSAAKKKAPVLWVVLDARDQPVDWERSATSARQGRRQRDLNQPWGSPHRVVKYVPEEKKR